MARESQYDESFEVVSNLDPKQMLMGAGVSWAYYSDPRHILFTLSRYKFCSKMLSGRQHVLEIGCGDAWASRLLLQDVDRITCTDTDRRFIEEAKSRRSEKWPIELQIHDFVDDGPIGDRYFDGAFCLDVIEHIPYKSHTVFLKNIKSSVKPGSMIIVGTPSLESQVYASPQSKKGHIGCMKQGELKDLCNDVFGNVMVFSMNDEMIHTGYPALSHYNIAVCF